MPRLPSHHFIQELLVSSPTVPRYPVEGNVMARQKQGWTQDLDSLQPTNTLSNISIIPRGCQAPHQVAKTTAFFNEIRPPYTPF